MLSMKAKYGMKALIVMARQEKKMMQAKAIAEEADIPQKFLEAILLELKHRGIVASKRGIFGGYFLTRPAKEIHVGDVVRVMDGPLAPIPCASVTAYRRCDDCVDEKTCGVRRAMVEVRNAIAGVLDKMTLAQLAKQKEAIL